MLEIRITMLPGISKWMSHSDTWAHITHKRCNRCSVDRYFPHFTVILKTEREEETAHITTNTLVQNQALKIAEISS